MSKVFETDWIKLTPEAKKLILCLMSRSCRPIVVTNGLSGDLSIISFMKVSRS